MQHRGTVGLRCRSECHQHACNHFMSERRKQLLATTRLHVPAGRDMHTVHCIVQQWQFQCATRSVLENGASYMKLCLRANCSCQTCKHLQTTSAILHGLTSYHQMGGTAHGSHCSSISVTSKPRSRKLAVSVLTEQPPKQTHRGQATAPQHKTVTSYALRAIRIPANSGTMHTATFFWGPRSVGGSAPHSLVASREKARLLTLR